MVMTTNHLVVTPEQLVAKDLVAITIWLTFVYMSLVAPTKPDV